MASQDQPVLVVFQYSGTKTTYFSTMEKIIEAGVFTDETGSLHVCAEGDQGLTILDIWPSATSEEAFKRDILPHILANGQTLSYKVLPILNLHSIAMDFNSMATSV